MKKITPGLDLHGDNGLRGGLGLVLLLLLVLSQALLADPGRLLILLLVIAAEEVDVLLRLGVLGGVDGQLLGLRAVAAVRLGGIAGEVGEITLVRGDVLVPARRVGVLLGVRGGLDGLVNGNISLRGRVASSSIVSHATSKISRRAKSNQRLQKKKAKGCAMREGYWDQSCTMCWLGRSNSRS